MSQSRKPHTGNAGYVCERKARLGGHIVVYDRKNGCDVAADERWIVMHEPSSGHIAIATESQARDLMKALAEARTIEEACEHADIFPHAEDPETPAAASSRAEEDELERAALERFLADPEDEPSAEGKAALRVAFRLDRKTTKRG